MPKVVILYTTFQTAAGTAVNAILAVGAAVSSSARNASSAWSDDNVGTSACRANTSASRCLRLEDTAASLKLSVDHVSMDSGGFTLNWTTVDASARKVAWVVLGGDISTYVAQITSATTTGNQAFTGFGFKPDCALLIKPHGQGSTTTAGGSVTVAPSVGFLKSATERATVAGIDRHGQAAADSARYQTASKCYTVLNNTSSVMIEG